MPGPQGAPRTDILALLSEGHSDRYIGRTLHTATKRVRRIRKELSLPPATTTSVITIDQKWATHTTPVDGGHLAWSGPRGPYGTPILCHGNGRHQARAVAFRQQYGRAPVGQVRPACGETWCVAPAHVLDRPGRACLEGQYTAIFGGVS